MSIRVDSRELLSRLKRLEQSFPDILEEAVVQEMVDVYKDMIPRIPVDTGALRESAYVERLGDAVEVGVSQSYGIFVHERTELRHAVGEAKFLEKALNARRPGMIERIQRRVYNDVQSGTVTKAETVPGNRGEIARRKASTSRYAPGRGKAKR